MTSQEREREPDSGKRDREDMVDLRKVEAPEPRDGGVDVRGELDRVDELAVQRKELRQLTVLREVARTLERDLVRVQLARDGIDDAGLLQRIEGGLLVRGDGEALDDARRPDERLVEGEQDRQLEDDRKAAAELVDAVLLVERHRLFRDLLAVALVLALQLANERLHPLHLLLRADLAHEERREDGADDDREDDDRQREVEERELVQEDQQVEERQEEDVPGRREVLDPQESRADDRGQIALSRLADRVIATRVEGVASPDALGAHPATRAAARSGRWPGRCSSSRSANSDSSAASTRSAAGRR